MHMVIDMLKIQWNLGNKKPPIRWLFGMCVGVFVGVFVGDLLP